MAVDVKSDLEALATAIGTDVKSLIAAVGDPFDTGRSLRLFRGSLGGTTPVDIHIMGASFEEGYGTTYMTNGWPFVFRDVIRAFAQSKGVAGGGSVPYNGSSLYQAGVGNYFGMNPYSRYTGAADDLYPDSPLTAFGGSLVATAGIGLGLRGMAGTAVNDTFTLEWWGTGMDLVYTTAPTFGAFNYSVDGAAPVVINEAVALAYGNREQIRGLSRGRHSIVCNVTSVGTGGSVSWEGASFYDGDESTGIRLWSAPKAGLGAKDYVAGTGQTAWVNSIQSWNIPDLFVIDLQYNDWNLGRTSAQWKTDMLAIIAAIKARCNTLIAGWVPSIVLMSPFSAIPASGTAAVEPYANFLAKANEIAIADEDVCLFDFQHWFGRPSDNAASTRGGINIPDGVHVTNGGSAIIGGALAEFVLDSAERMRDVVRWGVKPADPTYNAAITTPAAGFNNDTYVQGSAVDLPVGRLKAGTFYRCKIKVTKTGAGAQAPVVQVRLGSAGTTADTSRATLTFAVQTAVADDGFIEVFVTFRSVKTTGVIHAVGVLDHRLAATGLSTANTSITEATSAAFDNTTPTKIGVSLSAGASASWTISMVQAELQNAA